MFNPLLTLLPLGLLALTAQATPVERAGKIWFEKQVFKTIERDIDGVRYCFTVEDGAVPNPGQGTRIAL